MSSGLRVSRASDDAAGLAVASSLNVDSRVFSQGLRNLSDGVSVTNIAEGALNELTNIVVRLQELAEQAANGTLGARQRGSLDAEARALSKEYLRIAQTTEFNGCKLLDGSVQGLALQAGYGPEGMLRSSVAGKMGTGGFEAAALFGAASDGRSIASGDLNGDGLLDIVITGYSSNRVSLLLGNGDGSFQAKKDLVSGMGPSCVALGDLNGDGALDIVTANYNSDNSSVFLGNGDGTFGAKANIATGLLPMSITLGDLNADGTLDLISTNTGGSGSSVLLGNGDGTFKARVGYGTAISSKTVAVGDLNRDGALDIVAGAGNNASILLGNGDGTFKNEADYYAASTVSFVALGDLNGDGILDIAATGYDASGTGVLLGNGDGTFGASTRYETGPAPQSVALGDLNGDGVLDIVSGNSSNDTASVLLGNGDGSFGVRTDFGTGPSAETHGVTLGDLNRDGVLDIVSANSGIAYASVLLGRTRDGVAPLLSFSLKTKAEAKWALELMKQKLTQLSEQRGIIGANQSRISTAIANLQVERENYDAARSQITDVDVAAESATLVRTQILQQGASAILSQANQGPALALRLLSG